MIFRCESFFLYDIQRGMGQGVDMGLLGREEVGV